MQDATFEVRVPAALLQFGINQQDVQTQVSEWLVLNLFTEGHISSGRAARLLNMTRVEFLALLRKRGINYLDFSEEELAEEFQAVEELSNNSA